LEAGVSFNTFYRDLMPSGRDWRVLYIVFWDVSPSDVRLGFGATKGVPAS
jgi:hypothetical protein